MAVEPFIASKNYENSCFVLTDRKLSRIVEVARERLERVRGGLALNESYQVSFRDGKELRIDSLKNVLGLDNSHKNPITRVLAKLDIKVDEENVDYSLTILFSAKDLYYEEPMKISGLSKELGWLQETMGALEEQIERAIPRDYAYSINRSIGTFLTGVFLAILIALVFQLLSANNSNKFSESRKEELVKLSSSAKSEAEKNDFVFRYLSATLESDTRSGKVKRLLKESRTYLLGIPTLIAIFSALAAIFWFYPRNIFAWGDCGESYEKTIERRKFLWYGVVLALVIGVLGNLFVVGATG